MWPLPPTGARGGSQKIWPTFCIHTARPRSPRAHAVTLSASRNYAISTSSRCVTRAARQSARMVSAGTAGVRLGSCTAPAERARQIAVRGGDPGRGKSTFEPAPPGHPGRRALLAGRGSPGAVDLQAGHPVSPLAGRPTKTGPASLGRGARRVFRSGCFPRRMRNFSSHGRHADPSYTPLRAFPSYQTQVDWLAVVGSRQLPVASRRSPVTANSTSSSVQRGTHRNEVRF